MRRTQVLETRFEEYQGRVAELNKRAAKLGVAPIIFTVVEHIPAHIDESGRDLQPAVVILDVDGGIPHLAGWQMVAVLDHTTGMVFKIRNDDTTDLMPYLESSNRCDHCNVNRDRNKTFVVRHEDGSLKQVGSTCMRDYTGFGTDPDKLCDFLHELELMDEEGWGSIRGTYKIDLMTVLSLGNAIVREYGFKPSAFGQEATGSLVFYWEIDRVYGKKEKLDAMMQQVKVIDSDFTEAREVIEWVKSQIITEVGYLSNLKALFAGEIIDVRYINFAVSAIAARNRELIRKIKNAERPEIPAEAIGKRCAFSGVVIKAETRETQYGIRRVVTIKEDRGFLVWGTSDAYVGDRISFEARLDGTTPDKKLGFFKRPTKVVVVTPETVTE